jgi:stearoyl-CoA desaturase (delta-9 desaturase)
MTFGSTIDVPADTTVEGLSPAVSADHVLESAIARAQLTNARHEHRIALFSIMMPTLATAIALGAAITGWAVPSRFVLLLTGGFYVLTVLGITVGFHRLLTHRAFEAPAAVRAFLVVLGCMAAQGPPNFWVSSHRAHHRDSDGESDPHSPLAVAPGRWRGLRGLWHAHLGWMLEPAPSAKLFLASDLLRDRIVRTTGRGYFAWIGLGVVLPVLAAGLWHRSLSAALLGGLWGGLVRIFLVHQATWCVNSLCHCVGSRPFATADGSRNNALVALLTLGEGWHNNHHAFPASARHGLTCREPDPSYLAIRLLCALRLARNLKAADAGRVAAARQAARTAASFSSPKRGDPS